MSAPAEGLEPQPRLWPGAAVPAALGGLVALYCLWFPAYLPLIDLPNHMARHWLESRALAGEPLPPFYSVRYTILPNLGADLVLPPLLLVFSPLTAARIFLTFSLVLFWVGPAAFLAVACPDRTRALAAGLFLLPCVFDQHLFLGFLNYYSGFGLTFLVLAHFVYLSRRERLSLRSLLLHSLLIALLFLWHLSLWGIYGVVMGCHWIADSRRWNRGIGQKLLLLLPVLPSLGLLACYLWLKPAGATENVFDWGSVERKVILPIQLFGGYYPRIDLVAFLLWLAGLAVGFGLAHWRHCARNGMLLSLVVLGLLYLALPFRLGSTAHTDTRLLPAILVCGLGVVSTLPLQRVRLAFLLLAACLLIRGISVGANWTRLGDRMEQEAGLFDSLEPGGRILPIVLLPEASFEYPEMHLVCWSVPSRRTFVPTLFALPDQHTLRVLPPWNRCFQGYADAYAPNSFTVEESDVRGCFDYVWVYNPADKEVRLPAGCRKVGAVRGVTLYRVE
jgi:hypothetical protein